MSAGGIGIPQVPRAGTTRWAHEVYAHPEMLTEAQRAGPLWDTGNLQQWLAFFGQRQELGLARHDGPFSSK
jgi:hypothetical protein